MKKIETEVAREMMAVHEDIIMEKIVDGDVDPMERSSNSRGRKVLP